MAEKINVGLFIDAFFPMIDGVVMVVDNYAKRLSSFCNVTVFTLKPRGYKKYKREYPYKVVQCKKLIVPFLDYDLALPKSDRQFMKELNAANLDIVHIHSPFTLGKLGVEYARKHGIPVIATLHSQFKMDMMRETKSKRLTNALLKKIVKVFNDCDEMYAVNDSLAKVFVEYGADHLPKVQQNGTDMQPVQNEAEAIETVNNRFGLTKDEEVFLFVGRINKLKNIYFLLDSLKMIKTENFKMIFVGDGQDFNDFKSKVAATPISDKIIMTGKITDRELLKALYLRAKLFLFPSMYDSSSLVQIEAASQRTPTVFLKGSVTSGMVTDNVNGFLSDPTPEAFARKIDEILSDKELYNRVCDGAFRDIYVSWDSCIGEIYSKYLGHIEEYRLKKQ